MELFFSPLACSLATRIALYEAGADATFTYVDTRSKRTQAGDDFWAVNPMGQVPVLRTGGGLLLTENAAVLQYVAERFPAAQLMPEGGDERARLRQWLAFTGTELHKALFIPLLDPAAAPEVKAYARAKADLRLGVLQQHLSRQEHLLARFSIADAYLTAVLNWAPFAGVALGDWPAVGQYHRRMTQRPSIARAIAEEFALYEEQQARRAKAA